MKQVINSAKTMDELNQLTVNSINAVKPENIFSIGSIGFDGTEYFQNIVYIFN
jgi:hypothetical protein